jgi:WD40 repeat protein
MLPHRLLPFALLVVVLNLVAQAGHGQTPAQDPYGDPLPEGAIARAGQDRWLHGIRAMFAAFLPGGKQVVTLNSDGTLRIWDFPSGKEIGRGFLSDASAAGGFGLGGFGGPGGANVLALTPDGKTIASASLFRGAKGGGGKAAVDAAILFHDVASAKQLPQRIKLPEPKDGPKGKARFRVAGMAFSPNGEQLATLTGLGTITLWHWAKEKELWSNQIAVTGNAFTLFRLAFAPDGKSIATAQSIEEPMAKAIVEIRIWGAATGKLLQTLRTEADNDYVELALAFSPDGKTLAFTSGPTITLADATTGKEIGKLALPKQNDKAGDGSPYVDMAAVAFSKDGSKLYSTAFGNRGVMEWDLNTRTLVRESARAAGDGPAFAPSGEISLSPDGKTLVVTGIGPQFFDVTGGKAITAINRPTFPLQSLQYLPDGQGLVTSAGFGQGLGFGGGFGPQGGPTDMRKWDSVTGKEIGAVVLPAGAGSGGLSPDGKVVAGLQLVPPIADGGRKKAKVLLVHAANGKEISQVALQEPESSVGICFSPDSKMIAISQPKKQKLELYDVTTAKLLRTFDVKPGGNLGKGGGFGGRFGPQQTMLFTPDGKILAWSEAPNMATVVWLDTSTGKQIGTMALPQVPAGIGPGVGGKGGFGGLGGFAVMERAAASPDGRCIALEMFDGTTALFELASGQQRCTFGKKLVAPKDGAKDDMKAITVLLGAPGRGRTCFAFSPDGRSFAQSGPDGIIHVWDTVTGQELKQFQGHAEVVNALAYAPDGKTLASASSDSTALVWDVSKVARATPAARSLKPAELEVCWAALAGSDAADAYAKMGDLVAAPKDTVAFLKEQLKPVAPIDLERVQELIEQLDDPKFPVREKAARELEQLGEQVVPALDKALAGPLPLEPKRRAEIIRGKLTVMVLQGDRLRAYRAVEVLELIGTPEARQVLETLAKGAPGALLTMSAQAALKR